MKRKTESGQAIVTAAVTLTALLLAAGLAIDMGFLRYQRRHMQTAADSAALAAAGNLDADYATAAQTDAQLNGFTADSPSTTCPPSTPSGSTPITMCAQVIAPGGTGATGIVCPSSDQPCANVMISQSVPTFFMKVAGVNSEIVSTSAVARQAVVGCIYTLGADDYPSSGLGLWSVTVEGNVNADYCAVMSAGSLGVDSSSHSIASTALGASTATCAGICGTGQVFPAKADGSANIQKITAPPDLLSYLQGEIPTAPLAPAPGSCGYNYCAGTYTSAISINANNGTQITFQPGVYVLQGGLSITGDFYPTSNSWGTVTGDGVTFYNSGTTSISINPGLHYSNCDPTNLGASVRLKAPSSGPYAGILFFQDAADNQAVTITLNNGDTCNSDGDTTNESYAWGAIYAPGADLVVQGFGLDSTNGCSQLPKFTLLIAQNVALGGDVNINTDDCPYVQTDHPAKVKPYTGSDLPPSPVQKGAVIVQ